MCEMDELTLKVKGLNQDQFVWLVMSQDPLQAYRERGVSCFILRSKKLVVQFLIECQRIGLGPAILLGSVDPP
jgi:hypothetical protein